MSEIKTLEIEGRSYRMTVMSPWQGAAYAARVMRLVSSALAGEAEGFSGLQKSISEDGNLSSSQVIGLLTRVLPHVPAEDFTQLAREAFTSLVSPQGDSLGQEGLFNAWFNKYPGDYFPVAIWAIKENSAGFFTKGGAAWSALAGTFGLLVSLKRGKENGPSAD